MLPIRFERAVTGRGRLDQAVTRLLAFIEMADYRGYDPYDGLTAPLFTWPVFRSNRWLRFVAQQAVKRSPVNPRPLMGIVPGCNPVTLGLCIQAYTNLVAAGVLSANDGQRRINGLIETLVSLIPQGYHGPCWGYDFPWQARHFSVPAYAPTLVATGVITNALFRAYHTVNPPRARDLCTGAAAFVVKDINRTHHGAGFCFSYSPFDGQTVFNASMKGVRLLSQAHAIHPDNDLKKLAAKATAFVVEQQRDDGAWAYSGAGTGARIDNYHTGYVLDCLDEYIQHTGDTAYRDNLKKGYAFYRARFFWNDRAPKFCDDQRFPVDCTAAAQSILTLVRFGDLGTAANVALWTIEHMQDPTGFFYYRKYAGRTDRTPFMRWSNAWMLAGLTALQAAWSKT